jgi:hypothetical protein
MIREPAIRPFRRVLLSQPVELLQITNHEDFSMFKVEHFTLTGTDKTNMGVSLIGAPVSRVGVDIISGTAQFDQTGFTIGPDFRVDGTMVKWDNPTYTLYDQMDIGDKIRVIYEM